MFGHAGIWLRKIASYYVDELPLTSSDEKGKAVPFTEGKAVPFTVSHRFLTDYFYQGEYCNVLKPAWMRRISNWWNNRKAIDPEELHVKQLMIALVERMALLDLPRFRDFYKSLPSENEQEEKSSQYVIKKLHTLYTDLAGQEYRCLQAAADNYIELLKAKFLNPQSPHLNEYLQLVMMGEDLEAEKSALKEFCEEKEKLEAQGLKTKFKTLCEKRKERIKELKLLIKNEEIQEDTKEIAQEKLGIGKLTEDAEYFAKLINQKKSLLDKQLRDYKKSINRLAQVIYPKATIGLKKQDSNLLLKLETEGELTYDKHFIPLYKVSTIQSDISPKKKETRAVKSRSNTRSIIVGLLLGLGEAVVAISNKCQYSTTIKLGNDRKIVVRDCCG